MCVGGIDFEGSLVILHEFDKSFHLLVMLICGRLKNSMDDLKIKLQRTCGLRDPMHDDTHPRKGGR